MAVGSCEAWKQNAPNPQPHPLVMVGKASHQPRSELLRHNGTDSYFEFLERSAKQGLDGSAVHLFAADLGGTSFTASKNAVARSCTGSGERATISRTPARSRSGPVRGTASARKASSQRRTCAVNSKKDSPSGSTGRSI